MIARLLPTLCVVLALAPVAANANLADPRPGAMVVDAGPDGPRIFAGPDRLFVDADRMGRWTGSAIRFGDGRGERWSPLGPINGQVSDSVSDGDGGAYLAGLFDRLDGTRVDGLVHVGRDGRLDRAFRPQVRGFVSAVVLAGGRLYAADEGRVRGLDAATGKPLDGFAVAPLAATELALSPDGNRLYAAGDPVFPAPAGVRALDAVTGAVDPGFASPLPDEVNVEALQARDDRVFAGLAGRDEPLAQALVAVEPGTGASIPGFAPAATGGAFDLALSDGDLLVAGGEGFARMDPQTGERRAPDVATPGPIHAMTTDAGGRRWLVGGDARESDDGWIAQLGDGAVTRAGPAIDAPVDAVVSTSAGVIAGGRFAMAGVERTERPVTLSGPDLVVRSLRQPALDYVRPEVVTADRFVELTYSDGRGSAGGPRLTVADIASGRVLHRQAFRPDAGPTAAALDGDTLYVGRSPARSDLFGAGGDILRAYDVSSGERKRGFRFPLRGYVGDLTPGPAGRLYVAGSFKRRRPDGRKANIALVAVDRRTGAVDEAFDPHVDGPVGSVAVGPNGRVYATGFFSRAGPRRADGFAALRPGSGDALPGFRNPGSGDLLATSGGLQTSSQTVVSLDDGRVIHRADPDTEDVVVLVGPRVMSVATDRNPPALRSRRYVSVLP